MGGGINAFFWTQEFDTMNPFKNEKAQKNQKWGIFRNKASLVVMKFYGQFLV